MWGRLIGLFEISLLEFKLANILILNIARGYQVER